ncbi:hypothetical protein WA158_000849 [Blastocystis sp. Blastoise]
MTVERLCYFPYLIKRWNGDFSIAVYLPEKNVTTFCDFQKQSNLPSSVHFIEYITKNTTIYPINKLRNIAIKGCKTTHFWLTDIDMWPSTTLYASLITLPYSILSDNKQAIIVPAFEYHFREECNSFSNCSSLVNTSLPTDKESLLDCIKKWNCASFRKRHMTHTYLFDQWYSPLYHNPITPVICFLGSKQEPYVVLKKTNDLPLFNEEFINYGWNKIQWIEHLRYTGYNFSILSNAFGIDVPHPRSSPFRKPSKEKEVFVQSFLKSEDRKTLKEQPKKSLLHISLNHLFRNETILSPENMKLPRLSNNSRQYKYRFFPRVKITEMNFSEDSIPLLTLAVTFVTSDIDQKKCIQMSTLSLLKSFIPYIIPVVYTKDPIWINICKEQKIKYYTDFKTNYYGTPIFPTMMLDLEHNFKSTFYGYINGDILLHSRILYTLMYIKQLINSHKIKDKVFLSGRRINVPFAKLSPLPWSLYKRDIYLEDLAFDNNFFYSYALDYFIFTPSTFLWSEMKPVVIGRPSIDNYLVQYANTRSSTIDSFDSTNTILCIHQTGDDGNLAGHLPKKDQQWNRKMISDISQDGTVELSMYILTYTHDHTFYLFPQLYSYKIPYGDLYSEDDYHFFSVYIPQRGKRCLFIGEGVLAGSLTHLCEYTEAVLLIDQLNIKSPLQLDPVKHVNITYIHKPYKNVLYPSLEVSNDFENYALAVRQLPGKFDTVILDGRVQLFMFMSIQSKLENDAYIFIHDWNVYAYSFQSVIHNFDIIQILKTRHYPAGNLHPGLALLQVAS